jgi:SPX domain protein involved in polyphosphate accumulation
MRFGQTLANSVYEPWKEQYLDYAKLKRLLREGGTRDDNKPWTEDDESRFCDEILNTQLGKVAAFQESTFQKLEQRATNVGERLRDMAPQGGNNTDTAKFKEIEDELESITNEANQLKKYSALNYTGFLKIVKKHDRKRGNRYKVRPMLQINLSKRPFNSEQAYTPIINKLSIMYFIVRQNLEDRADKGLPNLGDGRSSSTVDMQPQPQNGEKYMAYKCEPGKTVWKL